jgi:hypothetical protein
MYNKLKYDSTRHLYYYIFLVLYSYHGAWFDGAWFDGAWFNGAWFNGAWFDGAWFESGVNREIDF